MSASGELASMKERSRIAIQREALRKMAEDDLICDALIVILNSIAKLVES